MKSYVARKRGLTRFPAARICPMIESSRMEYPPKLEPMSMKVGSEPAVIPFILCSVVVGGSAKLVNSNDRSGCILVNSFGSFKIWWWYGDVGSGGNGAKKSKRKASMMRNTTRLCEAERVQEPPGHELVSVSERRVSKKPRV